MTTENLSTLKIYKLTQDQYDSRLASGNIDKNALYLTPNEKVDMSLYTTKKEFDDHKHTVSDINSLQSTLDAKVAQTSFDSHVTDTTKHITSTERTNWNAAKTHASSAHAPSNAEPNQNAFGIIRVDGQDMIAPSKTSSIEFSTGTGIRVSEGNPKNTDYAINIINDGVTGIKGNSETTYRTGQVNITKANIGLNNVDNTSDANKPVSTAQQSAIDNALNSAKSYTDTKTSNMATTSVVDNKISTHNTSTSAHNDIRVLITSLTTKLNNFLDVDDTTTDQLSEVIALINNNKGTLESLTTSKINVSDIVNNLTTNSTNKVLSSAQGVAIKSLIDALQSELDSHTHAIADVSGLQSALDGKAASSHGTHVSYSTTAPVMDGTASVGSATTVARSDHKHPTDTSRAAKTDFDSHVADTTKHITSTERTNWNNAKTHADSAHAPSNAEKNQNAFGYIYNYDVDTKFNANSTSDGIGFFGAGGISVDVVEEPDGIAVFLSNTGVTGIKGNSETTYRTGQVNITKADIGLSNVDNTSDANKPVSTAQQAAIDSKANIDHTHKYAGSSSVGGAATSAVKWNTARNINGMSVDGSGDRFNYGTCSTDAATVEKTVACTGFNLITGAEITVKFTVTNTASSPTLNVNSTGAKAIYYRGSAITTSYLAANRTYTFRYNGTQYDLVGDIDTNTKNTAGSTDSSKKLFLIGAESQSSNPKTYSHDTAYVGTDGHLYSNSVQVVNLSDTQDLTNKTYNGYILADACTKGVTDSSSASAIGTGTNLVTERDVYYGLPTINDVHTYASSTKIYAPTSVGTNGYILKSSGSGAPAWIQSVPIANGGTGATTAAGALTNLGLTATATELNYCDGVTSNIQTQLNGKASSTHTHNYLSTDGGGLTGNLTISREGARTIYTDGTVNIWCGMNVAGTMWGLYDTTNSKYIIASDGTHSIVNFPLKIGNAIFAYDSTNKRLQITVS